MIWNPSPGSTAVLTSAFTPERDKTMNLRLLPLLALMALPTVRAQDEATGYAALVAEVDAARAKFTADLRALASTPEYKEALQARDRQALTDLRRNITPVDMATFVPRFQAGAEKHAGTDGAIDYLTWILLNRHGQTEAARYALDAILENHIGSAKLTNLAELSRATMGNLGRQGTDSLYAELIESSPHKMVQAWALYNRASDTQRNRSATAEQKAQATADLAKAETLADPDSILGYRLAGPKFAQEHLQIGMTAPDIVGDDVDGVSFKLSDYRGKVVVLDFWGDW